MRDFSYIFLFKFIVLFIINEHRGIEMDNKREIKTYPLTVGKDNTIKQFVERFYIVPRDMSFTEEEKNFREIFLLYIKSDYSCW